MFPVGTVSHCHKSDNLNGIKKASRIEKMKNNHPIQDTVSFSIIIQVKIINNNDDCNCANKNLAASDNTPWDANCTATYLPSRKLYRSDEPDTPDTAGEAKTSSLVTYYYGPPHMAKQKQDDQPQLTYSSYVRTRDVTQKTCRRWWTIGKSGERWSRISMLAARLDDDDDINIHTKVILL